MKQKLLALLFMAMLAFTATYAQNKTVSGKVVGAEDGLPLPGVSVKVKGTNVGSQTGVDGTFTLNVPADAKTLVFTYIGYTTLDVAIGNKTRFDVRLSEDAKQLSEVIITGYGTLTKKEVTGAITTVRGKDIESLPVQTFDRALQGRAAGVQVTTNGGQPGSGITVNIRGVSTINGSTQPLYIIDGVQVSPGGLSGQTTQNLLGAINPADVESVQVLKDAASASIYGSQAANGVVIITTKRGKSGKTQVKFSTQYGVNDQMNPYDLLSSPDYYALRAEAVRNRALRTGTSVATAIGALNSTLFGSATVPSTMVTTDWYDAVFRLGRFTQNDLSLAGGDEKTRFFISASYNKTEGTNLGSVYKRGTIRANVDHTISKKFSIESSISLAGVKSNGPSTNQGFFTNTPFTGGLFTPPVNPIYNADGTYNNNLVSAYGVNIVQSLNEEQRETGTFQTVSNLALNYKIMPELTWRTTAGIDFADAKDFNYRPSSIPIYAANGGTGAETFRRNINYTAGSTLNYVKTIATNHNLNVLGGVEYRSVDNTALSAGAQGFPSPLLTLLSSAGTPTSTGSSYTGYRLASILGTVRYDFKNKYLLTANVRYDGSSRFGANEKFGTFYGISTGWRITQENFMKSLEFVNDLKLRASYGLTGIQPSDDFRSIDLYGSGGTAGAYNGAASLRATQLGNADLTWEESAQINLGLDFSLFNNRLSGSVDVFQKNNTKLLLDRTLPSNSGFGSIRENAGEVEAKGIDVELSTVNFDTNGFKWTSSFNVSISRNKLLSLNAGATRIGNSYVVNEPLNTIYTYKYAGVNPADGRPFFYDINNNLTYNPVTADLRRVGDANAQFFGGLTNTLSYKGLTLDVLFQYQYGNEAYLQTLQVLEYSGSGSDNQIRSQLNRAWRAPGQVTDTPRPYDTGTEPGGINSSSLSSRYVQTASYIRLKQVTLNYKLPQSISKKIGVPGLNVFVQGLNLATWTNYRGEDPETTGNNLNAYPVSKTFAGGITLDF